jgi:hypothetical protein
VIEPQRFDPNLDFVGPGSGWSGQISNIKFAVSDEGEGTHGGMLAKAGDEN